MSFELLLTTQYLSKDGVIVSQGDAENLRTASGMSIVDQYKRIYAY